MPRLIRDAYDHMKSVIEASGAPPDQWYAGSTADPEGKLFSKDGHNVDRTGPDWVCVQLHAAASARKVEVRLVTDLGVAGGEGGGGPEGRFAYAYRMSKRTKP